MSVKSNYILGAAIISYVVVAVVYFVSFGGSGIGGTSEFAKFGDYIGGVVNPMLGLLTIFLLVQSLKVQSEELALSRNELANSVAEMAKSNDLMKAQSLIQTRVQSRLQVGQLFIDTINGYNNFMLYHKVRMKADGYGIQLGTLVTYAQEGVEKTRGEVKRVFAALAALDEAEKSENEYLHKSRLKVRDEIEKVVKVAHSLIFLTDNKIMVDVVADRVIEILGRLEPVKIMSEEYVEDLKIRLEGFKEERERFTDVPFFKSPADSV